VPKGMSRFAAGALLMVARSAGAQDAEPWPVPFERFNGTIYTALNIAPDDSSYGLTLFLSQTVVQPFFSEAGPVAAAFMYYVRPQPITFARYRFRIDASELTGASDSSRAFQIFTASAPVMVASWPQLLTVNLLGGTPYPILQLTTPRGGGKPIEQVLVPLSAAIAMVRVEIDVGAGTAGRVRYWIDADYSEQPTGVLDDDGNGLDNAAWSGVIGAAIGMSSTTSEFRAMCGGTFTIDQIGSSDDLLFGDNFEFGLQ
jgi:hypothetical protein